MHVAALRDRTAQSVVLKPPYLLSRKVPTTHTRDDTRSGSGVIHVLKMVYSVHTCTLRTYLYTAGDVKTRRTST